MPSKQSDIKKITDQIQDLNKDELRQVRDFTDNRLHEVDPDGSSKDNDKKNMLADMDNDELASLREDINNRLLGEADTKVSSADPSADDEKRKYIAQHGSNPIAQDTAQSVPAPVSDEIKELQDKASQIEQHAKGAPADGSR